MARVQMNVSGVHFEFDRKLFDDKMYHRLARMCEEAIKAGNALQFVEDRPSESFAAILTYYQTGELHMPTGVCPGSFKKELEYWELESDELAECCLFRYHSFFDDLETRRTFLKETTEPVAVNPMLVPVTTGNSLQKFRTRLWNIVDYREDSIIAKVYFVVVMLMVLVSIMNMAISTLPSLQRSLTKCELIEYLEHSDRDKLAIVKKGFGDIDCSGIDVDHSTSIDEDYLEEWYFYEYYYDYENTTVPNIVTLRKSAKDYAIPHLTIRKLWFDVIEYIVIAFFSIDMVLRLFSCPSLLRYFMSIVNIIEICAVVGSYIHVIVLHVEPHRKYEETWIRIVNYIQVFRTLRLFRIVRNVRASKVLAYSVRQNLRDGTMLAVLMLVGISTFGTLFFFMESRTDIDSIPLAWYWAIITMTTVGYGDISPKTAAGRVLASVSACSGVILLAVALPMFVNNFLTLYQYSCVDEILQKKRSMKQKLKGAIHAVSIDRHNIKRDQNGVLQVSHIDAFTKDNG